MSSSRKLQTVSLKSNQLLNKILKSHSSDTVQQRSDIQIEINDTKSNVEKESFVESETNCSEDDLTSIEHTSKTEPSDRKANNKTDTKKSHRKVSCEICGKLVQCYEIKYHLNAHNGWCVEGLF